MDEAFVLEHTRVVQPPLCPELRFHLCTPEDALWRATRSQLDAWRLGHPFWAFCWPGGQALARWLLDHPDVVKGRRVLDFGAGCGVAGIAAARAGASAVTATELDANALLAMDLNARLNGVTLDAVLLDVVDREHGCDVIVAADVCYDEEASRTLRWLHAQARRGVTVLLADAGRGFLPLEGLMHLATFSVPTHPDLEDAPARNAHVYRVG